MWGALCAAYTDRNYYLINLHDLISFVNFALFYVYPLISWACQCAISCLLLLVLAGMSYFEFYFFFNGVKCTNPLQIPPFYYIFFYSLIHYLPRRFSNVLIIQCDGCWGRGLRQGRFFWQAGLMAGLQVGRALRCSGCLCLGSAVPIPHVPGHPTFYMQRRC